MLLPVPWHLGPPRRCPPNAEWIRVPASRPEEPVWMCRTGVTAVALTPRVTAVVSDRSMPSGLHDAGAESATGGQHDRRLREPALAAPGQQGDSGVRHRSAVPHRIVVGEPNVLLPTVQPVPR